ncbi:hypothetical protein SS50377_23552 [Spironucleus salmonicida]|uniref:Uncharacterized protein n=1 Tax=Spironucleus salmonicida TaxID=348837 RepID=V6M5A1_9EUKA|nr:hypothetical protein SS50377_23552 [Spironucleus salmonicida]|eukprot:EST48534.1 Hypothetical protein SS50377_11145 [Spironucleus salmonicida]
MSQVKSLEQQILSEQKQLDIELTKLKQLEYQFQLERDLKKRQESRQKQRKIQEQQKEEEKIQKEKQFKNRIEEIHKIDYQSRTQNNQNKNQIQGRSSQVKETTMNEIKQQMESRKIAASQKWNQIMIEKHQRQNIKLQQASSQKLNAQKIQASRGQYSAQIEVYKNPQLITIPKGVVTANDIIEW